MSYADLLNRSRAHSRPPARRDRARDRRAARGASRNNRRGAPWLGTKRTSSCSRGTCISCGNSAHPRRVCWTASSSKIVAGFGSITRANTRLLALVRAGLLRRFFLGSGGGRRRSMRSRKGGAAVEVPCRGPRRPQDEMLVADFFVQHQLTINAIYCDLKFGKIPSPESRSIDGSRSTSRRAGLEPHPGRLCRVRDAYRHRRARSRSRPRP